MEHKEFLNWLKEHNYKCSIKQIRSLGFTEENINDTTCWKDSNGNPVLITYVSLDDEDYIFTIEEMNPIIEPQIPNTEEVVKKMEEWLDTQHYESPMSFSDKPFYDKFYERKGRKYNRVR